MSLLNSRVTRRTALVAGSGGALVAATAAVASAGSAPAGPDAATAGSGHGRPTVVDVTVTDAGFGLPRAIPAGLVTFRITSPETTYHALQGFCLKNGGTVAEIIEALRGGVNDDRAAAAAGHRTLLAKATLIGGTVGVQQQVIAVTVVLDPGTYYFLDINDYFLEGLANPRVHELRVVGRRGRVQLPAFDETIVAVPHEMEGMASDHTTFGFEAPIVMPRRGSFLMINASDEIHDVAWRHAKPGTTDAYLTEYYNAVVAGTPLPGPSPWLEPNTHGLQGFSPGRYAVVQIGFAEAGDYALVCYVPSDETGIPHTLEGMHLMTRLV
jgi:hypothetical protein